MARGGERLREDLSINTPKGGCQPNHAGFRAEKSIGFARPPVQAGIDATFTIGADNPGEWFSEGQNASPLGI